MHKGEMSPALVLALSEIRDGTLPKTLVFQGKDDTARHRAALICACALVCTSGGDKAPCLECEGCRRVLSEIHSDVTVLNCTSGDVRVDDVRKVRADAFVSPFEAECRIFILDGAQNLNVQSQNALLKILEEPPERAYFILTAPSSKMLLETVNSRCAVFSLGNPSYDDVYRSVCDAASGFGEEERRSIARAVLYIDGFEVTSQNLTRLKSALDICETYYGSGVFPFASLPSKKDDSEALKLTFKALSLCALEVCEAKKGVSVKDGILSASSLEFSVMKMPMRTAFSRSELFASLLERLEANANASAIIALLRTELGGV